MKHRSFAPFLLLFSSACVVGPIHEADLPDEGSEASTSGGSSGGAPEAGTSEGSTSEGSSGGGTTGYGGAPDVDDPACGDGVRAGDEECDDGDLDDDDGCSATCAADVRMFVSSARYVAGELQGVERADDRCVQLAKAAGLARPASFRAWLSDGEVDARDHVARGRGRIVRVDGQVVADDWDALFAGILAAAPEVTEAGGVYQGGVWTGTKSDGTGTDTNYCEDWTSKAPGDRSTFGASDRATFEWTIVFDGLAAECAAELAIYCFESL